VAHQLNSREPHHDSLREKTRIPPLRQIRAVVAHPVSVGLLQCLKMGMRPTYPRAVIALDRTTVGNATRSKAGGDLPRLQDSDAHQGTSAAQAEHGAGGACVRVPAVWNGDEARHQAAGETRDRPPRRPAPAKLIVARATSLWCRTAR
jgi:hypothetical protein